MITLSKSNRGTLLMRCDYSYRQRCRKISGAEFNKEVKAWEVPMLSLPQIQCEFAGEIYYKTPLWKLEGKTEPPKKDVSFMASPIDIPRMRIEPYKYQETGIKFLVDRLNNLGFALLGDDVGLGKTPQTIGALKWFVENRGIRKILIVCKKSIKHQWAEEIREFAGWQQVPIYLSGKNKKKRIEAYEDFARSKNAILILNYHNFLNDSDIIEKLHFDIAVVDEAHCIKAGKMNELISKTINGKSCILLTGTPVMSKPDDIYGVIHLATPNYFGSYKDFEDRYLVIDTGIYGRQIVGARNLDELQDKISAFLLRRTAEEVEKDLPEVLPPRKIIAEMDETQDEMLKVIERMKSRLDQEKSQILDSKGYDDITATLIDELNDKEKAYLAVEQMVADDPSLMALLDPKKGINGQLKNMLPKGYGISAKTEALLDKVQEIIASDGKVIIFTHYETPAKYLKELVEKKLKINALLYTGKQGDDERAENVRLFKTSEDYNVLIGNEACAEGLNLQVAQYIIHYEQADTYAQRVQRIGRIRRVGSAFKNLIVYDIVTENSRDERKLRKIQKDKELAKALGT